MKVLLIKPWENSFNWYHSHMLSLSYLASYVRSLGHKVEIIDASFERLNQDQLINRIKETQADIAGVTSMTHEIPKARIIFRSIKSMKHVNLINEEILQKAKESNCYKICIGIESGNNEILKRIHRNYTIDEAYKAVQKIKKYQIRPFTFYILGHPGETHKTVRDTIRSAVKINPFEMGMGIMVPYPGTEIFTLASENKDGYELTDVDWDGYNRYGNTALKFKNFSSRQLLYYQIIGNLLFYIMNGKIIGLIKYVSPKIKAVFRLLL